ncbi:glycosyltransferase [Pseudarthrobacter oxydans]|uniref:glycosyltransferase n=1 Tax=Pseudarthrobacter oxydans TaxID=1671 RepID=UPI0037FD53D2
MLPPAPLALVARLVRGRHHVRNFYDLHTGFFHDPKWQWASSWTLRLLRGSTAIVTNTNLATLCDRAGVRAHVLHDVLLRHDGQSIPGPYIVCPVSYSNDEPIDRILEAAGNLPDTRWLLTGEAPNGVRAKAPANVEFSGFLSDTEYDAALRNASLVVALTNRRDTMQRAGYEALMRGVPVVTSDFEVLRDFFEDSAVYVAAGEVDLEHQIGVATKERASLAVRCQEVLSQRIIEQDVELSRLRKLLDARSIIRKGN